MHIPDGYLSPSTCAALAAAATPFWAVAFNRLKRSLSTRMVPMISIIGAFSFVIMMFNVPLPGGTTGHAVGMGIASIVLGPWGSIIAITVALILQALLFGDGGILAIGANCLNMAIIGSMVAYGTYRLLVGRSALTAVRRVVAGAIAGYVAINVSALAAAIEFGVQPMLFHDASGVPLYSFYPLSVAIPAMMIGHLTIAGLAEAIFTGGLIAFLQKVDVSLLRASAPDSGPAGATTTMTSPKLSPLVGAVLALCLLTPLGLLAAGTAWGEWGGEALPTQQVTSYLGQLDPAKGTALASDLDLLAASTADTSAANDYRSAAAAVRAGKTADAANLIRPHIEALQSADLARFSQLVPLVAAAKPSSGLSQLSSLWRAPLGGYAPGFVASAQLGYILSALVGVTAVGFIVFVIGRIAARRDAARRSTSST